MSNKIKEIKEYIKDQICENPLVIEFIKNANMDDLLSLGNSLNKIGAVTKMSLYDWQLLGECAEEVDI